MTEQDLPRELSVSEAAALLRMSKADVRLAMRKGELPARRRGSRDVVITAGLLERLRGQA